MMRDFFTVLFSLLFWPAIALNLDKAGGQLTSSVDVLRDAWAAEYQLQYDAMREALRCNLKDAAAYLGQMAPSAQSGIDEALQQYLEQLPPPPAAPRAHGGRFWLATESYHQKNPQLPWLYPNWYYRFIGEKTGG